MKETAFHTKDSKSEEDVINFYEEYANNWDDRFGNTFSTHYFIERRWRSFQDAVRSCEFINHIAVELGVGTGVYIDRSAAIFEKIIAIDGSSAMLKLTQEKLTSKDISSVSLVQSNVLNIQQISDSSVDCVYFFGLIEHIVELDKFIDELKRILKKDGVVIGVTPNAASPWYAVRSIIRGTGKHCSTDTYYSIDDLDSIFSLYGFSRVYLSQWGAVPAGISNTLGWLLAKIEPYIEKTPLKKFLGGLTFVYRLT